MYTKVIEIKISHTLFSVVKCMIIDYFINYVDSPNIALV